MGRITSREEALFGDAIALPSSERGAFLAKACGANVVLLAHLVALVSARLRVILHDEKPGDAIGLSAVGSAQARQLNGLRPLHVSSLESHPIPAAPLQRKRAAA